MSNCPDFNRQNQRPIFLIGMPGSGKSTIGLRLADRLGWTFVDADRELEHRCGVSVATMFEIEGEVGFRDRESRLLVELCRLKNTVVATGGGAVLSETNRECMHEHADVVYLQASVAELWHRVRHDKRRPLLQGEDPRARIQKLFDVRTAIYQGLAHVSVKNRRQSIERFVGDIIEALSILRPE